MAKRNLIRFEGNHIITSLPLIDLLETCYWDAGEDACIQTEALRGYVEEDVNGKHIRRRHYSVRRTCSPPRGKSPQFGAEAVKDPMKQLINTVRYQDIRWGVPVSKRSWRS